MQTATVKDLGAVGYIADKEPVTLPINAWNEMQNIRCRDRSIESFEGHESIGNITVIPQTLTSVKTGQRTYLVYANDDSIYALSAGTETDISQYAFSTGGRWDSCVLGGVAILNNGLDNPQVWGGEGLSVDLPFDATDPSNVCSWESQELKAKIIRPFRYHLFAFDIDDCAGRNRRRLMWSHPAEPGSVPITWDFTKADYDAGDAELSETNGYILDALQLRDTLQIYMDGAIYSATYTGRQDRNIFTFRPVTTSKGIYARNCVADIGGRHFLVSDGEIYLYDGMNFEPIADERVKKLFFDGGVSRAHYENTFCHYYHRTGEVWLCYPVPGDRYCTKALVWDTNQNVWSQRDIPECTAATFAVVDRVSTYTWATLPYATWADWGITPASPLWTQWILPIDNAPIYDSLLLGGETKMFEMDVDNTADGTIMTCYCRRTEIDLGDKADWHKVLKLYPHAEGDAFRVRIGSQNLVTDPVTWTGYQTFTPGTDYQLDFRVTGRLHAIEFSSAADVSWKVSGYEVDYERVARR